MAAGGSGGGYPYAQMHGKDTHEERFDYPRTVWYKIPLFQKSTSTRIEFDPEICKLLERAYQTGQDRATFEDKNTGSSYTANFKTKTVYLDGNFTTHAHLERVELLPTSSDSEKSANTKGQAMVEEYRDLGMKLVNWMKQVHDVMKKKIFPDTISKMLAQVEEFARFETDQVPKMLQTKERMFKIFYELQEHGAGAYTRSIDESMQPNHVQDEWNKFETEKLNYEAAQQAEVARLQSLQSTVENFHREAQTLEKSIDDIRYSIDAEARRLGKVQSLEIKQECDTLELTLNAIHAEVINLGKFLHFLEDGGYPNVDQLHKRVHSLMTDVSQMKTALINVIQKLPSSSVVEEMARTTTAKTVQHKQCDKLQQMEANPFFQQVQHCVKWIEAKKASLEIVEYFDNPNLIKQALEQHQKKHDEIMEFNTEIKKCMADRTCLTSEEQKVYPDLLSTIQTDYPVLVYLLEELRKYNLAVGLDHISLSINCCAFFEAKTSLQQLKNQQSLQEFVQSAIQEITWLNDKTEETYKCSSETSMPFEKTFQNLSEAMNGRLEQLTSLQTQGNSMVNMNHPASKIIQDYTSAILYRCSWLLQLLNCLKVHAQHLLACNQFFEEGKECEQWMILQTTTINKWMMCQNQSVEDLQMMQRECQTLQMSLDEFSKKIDSLSRRSCTVVPLQQQVQKLTSLIKVQCLCDYEQPTMSFHKGQEYTVIDNSQKARWKVRNSSGEFEIHSVCLQILPPNVEAVDFADRLNKQLDELKKLLWSHMRNLTENFVLSQIQFIKDLDVRQFESLDLAQQDALLRNLNDEAAKLINDVVESDKKLQLQQELDGCKQKLNDFTRELQEKAISCQWKEFKMRFEFETAKKCYKTKDYTIKEISPVQMQYIADTRDERDFLMEKLIKRNLRGMFECGLLRILLQEEEDMTRMMADPDGNSDLVEEVIAILKSHAQTQPAIQEEILSHVVQEDVQQAQELGHLECLRSSKVKIYIRKSGKVVSIVGREVDKCIESIHRALDQRNRNEPVPRRVQYQTEDAVSSVSETKRSKRGYDTDGEVLIEESLEHAEEAVKKLKKLGEAVVERKNVTLTISATQMLEDSDYTRAVSTAIQEVAVHYISNKVVFQGPPEAVMKAECHLEQYLKSKGYWYEVDQTEYHIELSKRQNFDDYLKGKIPDVHIKFTDKKIIFIGNKSKESYKELCQFLFLGSTMTKFIEYESFFVSYLKVHDVQKYIWEQFENRHIKCFWQVTMSGIHLSFRNDEDLAAAVNTLEKCMSVSKLSFKSVRDLQDFETCPDIKSLIHQSEGRLHKEVVQADCVIYVGMPEVIAQIRELHDRHMIAKRNHSSRVLLSHHLLAYVTKYLMENMKKKFEVDIQELDDLSGIKISGAEGNVQNAVSEVQEKAQQIPIYMNSLDSPEVTNTFARQVKEIVATVEKENNTVVDVISLPRKGKVIRRVQLSKTLDVCLVYGSNPGREVDMQLIPVNDTLSPFCLAAIDLMKGNLQEKTAAAFQRYINQKGNKLEVFSLFPYDEGNNQHVVYFVMPDLPSILVDFEKKFKQGLFAVFDNASQRNMASLSFPVEMHEKLPARQTSSIILETLNAYLAEVTHEISFRDIYLCSVEKCNQSVLIQNLDSVIPNDLGIDRGVGKEDDSYHIVDEEDKQVNITVVVGSLLEQQVDVIVNSASKELALEMGSLSKIILNAAGGKIQDECRQNYPNGIKFGEVAVTSPGLLKFKKIFHGALCRVDLQKSSHLLVLRSLMKNCLKQAGLESCHSIAFPALGIGALNYPTELVAKDMFWAATTYAKQYGVSDVKFVIPEDDKKVYTIFKQMESTMNNLLQPAQDCWPVYDISFVDSGVKVAITGQEKLIMCDADVFLGKPKASANAVKINISWSEGNFAKKATVLVNSDPKNWNERLYLCLDNLAAFKEVLYHAVLYVKQMKLTSMSLHLAPIKKESVVKSTIQDVIDLLAKHRLDLGDLERVLITISDDMLQKLTPWFEESVKASQGSKSAGKFLLSLFVQQVQVTWRKLQAPCPETSRTYIRIIGPDYSVVNTSCKTVERKIKQLIAKEEKEDEVQSDADHERHKEGPVSDTNGAMSSHASGKAGVHDLPSDTDSSKEDKKAPEDEVQSDADREIPKEGSISDTNGAMSLHASGKAGVHDLPSDTELFKEDKNAPEVYCDFKTEVAKDVLNIIRDTHGEEGIHTLACDLKQIANKVDISSGKVFVFCDFKCAKEVQKCVFNYYEKARRERKKAQNILTKHLIEKGSSEMKDLLQFACGHEDWSQKLHIEGGQLYLFGTLRLKEEVDKVVQTVSQWCQDEFFLSSDEKHKAEEAMNTVKNEFPAIFIKRTSDKIIMKGSEVDSFEKAKHKMKVALGRVKITSGGRRHRNLQADSESFSSLCQDDRKEESQMSLPSNLLTAQHGADIASKTYHTREGIVVKVYYGNIVKLQVDCIINAANQNLAHGGGVALAISKAAGRAFDQEGEEYVRKHGLIPVTKCCVTSAGRLFYKAVIHVVGPQWHDYKQDEKDRCGEDLKKTIVNCLIEANSLKVTSIAIPSISSGIFGVPKPLCAQMYAHGVIEYSKTCGLQSVKEIHFVDMISEMCQLTQLAFDAELNNPKGNIPKPSGGTNQSHMMDNHPPARPRLPQEPENFHMKTLHEASATSRPSSYAEVTAGNKGLHQGTRQNPYVFQAWDTLRILIYSHDITEVDVNAIVCPVDPNIEGSLVQSVKRVCGPAYADTDYKSVKTSITDVGDVIITPVGNTKVPFHQIIHVYSPRWIGLKLHKDWKCFEEQLKKAITNIFEKASSYGLASVALPVLGIGDATTPLNKICESMMDGIVDFCVCLDMVPAALTAIHVITNDHVLLLKLKDLACQKFGQNPEVTGLQSRERNVTFSKHGQNILRVTVKNDNHTSIPGGPLSLSHHSSMTGHEGQEKYCPICMNTLVEPKPFDKCGHILCRECMDRTMKSKLVCPVCNMMYGNQPRGTMQVKTTNDKLPGFKNCGTIDIFYQFPGGIQTEEHPNPGQPYQGTSRRAYLPDNAEGRKVMCLLRKAFYRRLVFTIGRSVTTGEDNVVTWSDIHHKTSIDGGPQKFGYPDEGYLKRVQEELAAKGVTDNT